jgi:hypothetical protein
LKANKRTFSRKLKNKPQQSTTKKRSSKATKSSKQTPSEGHIDTEENNNEPKQKKNIVRPA